MKTKLLMGIGTLLLASSSMFAGWGVSVGGGYYGPRAGVVVAGGGPVYAPYCYRPRHYVVAPSYGYVAAAPYGYVAPAPAYVAPPVVSAWIAPHWEYGVRGRYWVRGHYGRRW